MTIMAGPYALLEPHAVGGMAEVWRAEHCHTKTVVAIKIMRRKGVEPEERLRSLPHEVRAMAALDHPNIAWVFDHGVFDERAAEASGGRVRAGDPWVGIEWASGGTLRKYRDQLVWPQIRTLAARLLEALAHAHARGVIHRDVKPGNVLYGGADGTVPKLSDFGLAMALDRSDGELSDLLAGGTPAYMAPEQLLGRGDLQGPWTDLYALGCVVWRLMTHRPLFPGTREEIVRQHLRAPVPRLCQSEEVPRGVEGWLRGLLRKNPGDRYRTAVQALQVLQAVDGQTRGGRRDDWRDAPWNRPRGSASPALFSVRRLPLLGRDFERRALWSELTKLRTEPRMRIVALHGPSGCGKTGLARWLVHRAYETFGIEYTWATHGPSPGPLDGLGGMVARRYRAVGLDQTEAPGAIAELMRFETHQSDDDEVRDLASMVVPTDRVLSQPERHALVRRLLLRGTRERPMIAVFDDVHLARDSLQFVEFLASSRSSRRPAVLAVLVLGEEAPTNQSHGVPLTATMSGITSIHVGPIAEEERVSAVRSMLRVDDALAAELAQRTDGNPGFIVQVLESWIDAGLLEVQGEGLALRVGATPTVAESLDAVWHERLSLFWEGRSEQDLRALEVAAGLGLQVHVEEWLAACERIGVRPSPDLVPDLAERRLVVEEEGGKAWSLESGRLREAVLRVARDGGRIQDVHLACAAALEGSRGADVQERRGRHLLAADRPEAALGPLLEGALVQRKEGRLAESLATLERWEHTGNLLGLEATDPRRLEGLLALADAHRLLCHLDAAEALAVRVRWLAGRTRNTALEVRALLCLAWCAVGRGTSTRATELGHQALGLADPGAPAHARILSLLANSAWRRGELSTALKLGQRAYKEHLARREEDSAAHALHTICAAAMGTGQLGTAKRAASAQLMLARKTGSRLHLGIAHNAMGEVLRAVGDLKRAEGHYRDAARWYSAAGKDTPLPWINLAMVLLDQREYADARRSLESVLSDILHPEFELAARAALAVCTADGEGFEAHMGQLRSLLEKTGARDAEIAGLLRRAGERALGAGRRGRAWDAWRSASRLWAAIGRTEEQAADDARLEALRRPS